MSEQCGRSLPTPKTGSGWSSPAGAIDRHSAGARAGSPIELHDVVRARRNAGSQVMVTPCLNAWPVSEVCGARVAVKCEQLQRGGSFKFRGAFNGVAKLLEGADAVEGVVVGSSGNFGIATALAARHFGVKCVVVLARDTPEYKRVTIARMGAEIVEFDRYSEDRARVVETSSATRGWATLSANQDASVIAGMGTVTLEVLSQCPDLDVLVMPLGGGGLLSGAAIVAEQLWPTGRLVGVQPAAADDAAQSFSAGRLVHPPIGRTAADGLQVQLSEVTWDLLGRRLDAVLTVGEDAIMEAQQFALDHLKMLIEPSSACALAALLNGALEVKPEERVGLVLSGGNYRLQAVSDAGSDA